MNWKCLFGHKWNGCKCEKCGEMRNEGHNYLAVDGKCIEECSKCYKILEVGHKWILLEKKCIEKCTICGKERDSHQWDSGKCERCKKTRRVDIPSCMMCGIDKESIEKRQYEDRKTIEKARAQGSGMMMFGMTPSRDFMKCLKCDKIACSSCSTVNCPFCNEKYLKNSVIIKSKSVFVQ